MSIEIIELEIFAARKRQQKELIKEPETVVRKLEGRIMTVTAKHRIQI